VNSKVKRASGLHQIHQSLDLILVARVPQSSGVVAESFGKGREEVVKDTSRRLVELNIGVLTGSIHVAIAVSSGYSFVRVRALVIVDGSLGAALGCLPCLPDPKPSPCTHRHY